MSLLTFNAAKDAFLHIVEQGDKKVVPVNTFMGVDPASSTRQTADYSVIFPIAVDELMNIYCLPYFRRRVTPMILADNILSYYKTYLPRKVNIETTGYQEMLRDYLRNQELYIPGLEVKNQPRTNKSGRLESMEPMFRSGKVHLLSGMQEFIDELLMFPRSKHDDVMDAFYYATRRIYPPYHGMEGYKQSTEGEHYKRGRMFDWKVV